MLFTLPDPHEYEMHVYGGASAIGIHSVSTQRLPQSSTKEVSGGVGSVAGTSSLKMLSGALEMLFIVSAV